MRGRIAKTTNHQPLTASMISPDDFAEVDIRVGTILAADEFPEARVPAFKLRIDFGEELGQKRSSAQITNMYSMRELVGRQVVAVVNFPPKRIANFESDVLVLGVVGDERGVVLLAPDEKVPNGLRIG